MSWNYLLARVSICMIAVSVLSGCGLGLSGDKMEENDPLIRRAQARKNVQDIDGAIDLYTKALERKPHLARAHLEMGLLYDQYKEDYIQAIYHYQRYLELRPKTEKKKLIEDLIRHARISFAATLPYQPSGAIQEISLLKKEIESLRQELDEARGEAVVLRKPAAGKRSSAVVRAATPKIKPKPARPPVRTYVVQTGDTLSRIASKMYNDPGKWDVIAQANKSTLPNPETVRVGQTLVIPPLD